MSATLPPHIHQTRNGTFTARLRVPADLQPVLGKTELHKSLHTKNLREAKVLAPTIVAQLRSQLDEAKLAPHPDHGTPIGAAAEFLPPRPRHKAVLQDLINHTRLQHVEYLTLSHWQRWCYSREDLQPQRTVATVRNETTLIRSAILKLMASRRLPFDRNLLTHPKWRETTKTEIRNRQQANSPYTLERWQELYDAMPRRTAFQRSCRAAFALGLLTGARISEIANMTTAQIQDNLWTIPRSKTLHGERTIPLTPLAQDVIASLTPDPDGFLFSRRDDDWSTQATRYSMALARTLKKAGAASHETMHSTRSTFRTLVPRYASSPEGTIDMLMGHAPPKHVAAAYYRASLADCISLMHAYRPSIRLD